MGVAERVALVPGRLGRVVLDPLKNLLRGNPFSELQEFMRTVVESTALIPELVEAMAAGDMPRVEEIAAQVGEVESKADTVKNTIRKHLPSTLFLPVARADLLEVITAMDEIADAAEDLAVSATMRALVWNEALRANYQDLVNKVLETVACVVEAVEELDDLTEASFGGAEAERFLEMVSSIGRMEEAVEEAQDTLLRQLYRSGEEWSTPDFVLWLEITKRTGAVADAADRLGNRLRAFVTRR